MAHNDEMFLLTIRGTLSSSTVEESRKIHNDTAGHPEGVAAARALGDLSHNVYVQLGDAEAGAGELLIMDLWNSPSGFEKFFSSPQVQTGGGRIFTQREPSVWTRATDFRSFHLPSPHARRERFVGVVRGVVKSRDSAREAFDGIAKASVNAARMLGQVSHEIYFRMTPPGETPTLELLGVDVWQDADGMGAFYQDPKHLAPLRDVWSAPPVASMWKQPAGHWVEW